MGEMGRARNRSGMEGFMNDIITRLDEIEERADAILAETENRKNDMAKQLEADKQAIDVKYDKMLKAHMQELSERLRGEAKREIERISGRMMWRSQGFHRYMKSRGNSWRSRS